MSIRIYAQRLIASSLSLLLVSCGVTRLGVVEPSGPGELSRYVLLIQELPDGQMTHRWELARDFKLEPHQEQWRGSNRVQGRIVPVAWQRNCDEELKKCLSQCMGGNLGGNWEHLFHPPGRKLGGKHAECRRRCWPLYDDCHKQNAEDAAKAMEFSSIDKAIDWLKRHRKEVLVGAVVVIAGVAFVVVTGGSGGLVLAPALLFVSSDAQPERDSIAVKP